MNEPPLIKSALEAPLGLLAELTHVCPLGCPYCSNPIALDARAVELDTQTWLRIFSEMPRPAASSAALLMRRPDESLSIDWEIASDVADR